MNMRRDYLAGNGPPFIDMHGHMGPFHGIWMPEAEVDRMIVGMDRCGMEALVLSPHSALSGDVREGNDDMLTAVRRYPGRIYGYCTVNPNYPDSVEREMDRCLGVPGVVGIKIHPNMHDTNATDDSYRPVWERANMERWPVLSHTWGSDGTCGTREMRTIAERWPDIPLLLGHSCYGAWAEAIALAKAHPNVYLELCAAYHVFGLLEWMVREAGSTKVIYGTDYPWFDPMVVVGCVTYAHISEEDMANILYNNARSILEPVLEKTGGPKPGNMP